MAGEYWTLLITFLIMLLLSPQSTSLEISKEYNSTSDLDVETDRNISENATGAMGAKRDNVDLDLNYSEFYNPNPPSSQKYGFKTSESIRFPSIQPVPDDIMSRVKERQETVNTGDLSNRDYERKRSKQFRYHFTGITRPKALLPPNQKRRRRVFHRPYNTSRNYPSSSPNVFAREGGDKMMFGRSRNVKSKSREVDLVVSNETKHGHPQEILSPIVIVDTLTTAPPKEPEKSEIAHDVDSRRYSSQIAKMELEKVDDKSSHQTTLTEKAKASSPWHNFTNTNTAKFLSGTTVRPLLTKRRPKFTAATTTPPNRVTKFDSTTTTRPNRATNIHSTTTIRPNREAKFDSHPQLIPFRSSVGIPNYFQRMPITTSFIGRRPTITPTTTMRPKLRKKHPIFGQTDSENLSVYIKSKRPESKYANLDILSHWSSPYEFRKYNATQILGTSDFNQYIPQDTFTNYYDHQGGVLSPSITGTSTQSSLSPPPAFTKIRNTDFTSSPSLLPRHYSLPYPPPHGFPFPPMPPYSFPIPTTTPMPSFPFSKSHVPPNLAPKNHISNDVYSKLPISSVRSNSPDSVFGYKPTVSPVTFTSNAIPITQSPTYSPVTPSPTVSPITPTFSPTNSPRSPISSLFPKRPLLSVTTPKPISPSVISRTPIPPLFSKPSLSPIPPSIPITFSRPPYASTTLRPSIPTPSFRPTISPGFSKPLVSSKPTLSSIVSKPTLFPRFPKPTASPFSVKSITSYTYDNPTPTPHVSPVPYFKPTILPNYSTKPPLSTIASSPSQSSVFSKPPTSSITPIPTYTPVTSASPILPTVHPTFLPKPPTTPSYNSLSSPKPSRRVIRPFHRTSNPRTTSKPLPQTTPKPRRIAKTRFQVTEKPVRVNKPYRVLQNVRPLPRQQARRYFPNTTPNNSPIHHFDAPIFESIKAHQARNQGQQVIPNRLFEVTTTPSYEIIYNPHHSLESEPQFRNPVFESTRIRQTYKPSHHYSEYDHQVIPNHNHQSITDSRYRVTTSPHRQFITNPRHQITTNPGHHIIRKPSYEVINQPSPLSYGDQEFKEWDLGDQGTPDLTNNLLSPAAYSSPDNIVPGGGATLSPGDRGGGRIPGLSGVGVIDYPMYATIPITTFTCVGRTNGYYADPEARCQVFHMCHQRGRQDSFLCPNGTLFHQGYLTCDHWYKVHCQADAVLYHLNNNIYQKKRKREDSDHKQQKHTVKPQTQKPRYSQATRKDRSKPNTSVPRSSPTTISNHNNLPTSKPPKSTRAQPVYAQVVDTFVTESYGGINPSQQTFSRLEVDVRTTQYPSVRTRARTTTLPPSLPVTKKDVTLPPPYAAAALLASVANYKEFEDVSTALNKKVPSKKKEKSSVKYAPVPLTMSPHIVDPLKVKPFLP